MTIGTRYRYRVAAAVDGGERVRSAWVAVTAGRGNQGPVPVGILADRMLEVGASAIEVDVAGAFSDPDSDALSYAASSSASSVASVSRTGSRLTITPRSAGAARITVTATDAGGSATSATQRFAVRVGYDYDSDGDGLIEIETLAQLDAVRYDLNGTGRVDLRRRCGGLRGGVPGRLRPDGLQRRRLLGLRAGSRPELRHQREREGRRGRYVLERRRRVGACRRPLPEIIFGTPLGAFRTTFDGNGHTLSNLFVDGEDYAGLFGAIRSYRRGPQRPADRRGRDRRAASSAGWPGGTTAPSAVSQATGSVAGEVQVGGLVGANRGTSSPWPAAPRR